MKKWQIENSEISEKLFRVSLFPSFLGFKNLGKKIRDFRVFNLATETY